MTAPVPVTATLQHVITWDPTDHNRVPFHTSVTLTFNPTHPFEVAMDIRSEGAPETVPWVFGRSLLATGLIRPSGDGDVHVAPAPAGWILVALRSPYGTCVLRLPALTVCAFMNASYQQVPDGSEPTGDVDAELARLLGEAG